jgi:hypothetical protein
MKATPITPGSLYRVSLPDRCLFVAAPNAAAAICVVLDMLEVRNA